MKTITTLLLTAAFGWLAGTGGEAFAASDEQSGGATSGMMSQRMMAPGLMMPSMDPVAGKALFAGKGCVVCHSINGVGGEDAPKLDASTMQTPMNPFEFAAKMWRGAEAMVYLQREEIGEQIELTGQELANIIAFVHDESEQQTFSDADIPPGIRELMHHMEGGEAEHEAEHEHDTDE